MGELRIALGGLRVPARSESREQEFGLFSLRLLLLKEDWRRGLATNGTGCALRSVTWENV